ncbi:MAG: putative family peptidase [Acidobacteria bacterium]|nr:putative family peptidase [Acidobacteriota bacterium]
MLQSGRIGLSLPLTAAFVCVCAAAIGAMPPQGPGGRALAIEDYYRIRSVGSPSISPNGKWVLYTVQTRIEEDNSTRSEAYLVQSDGSSAPRRLQHDGKAVTAARFNEEGWLQYSSGGLWKIDPEKPDAAPVKAESLPSGSVPSPDGKWIASTKDKPLPKPAPDSLSDFERRHQQRFKGAIFDWKDFQRDGQPFPAPDQRARPAAQVVITPAGSSEARTLTDLDLRPAGLTWHPDGKLLAFLADSHWRDELSYERTDLWTVSIDGRVTRLTDDLYTYGDLDFSPDGRYLSCIRSYGTDMIIREKLNHGGSQDIFIREVNGSKPVNLTADWDLDPGSTRWSPDSRYIYFTAGIGGESHLFRVSVPGAKVEQVTKGARRISGPAIDRGFRTIAYSVGSHEAPAEIYAANIDGTKERRLTNVHADILAEIAFSNAERLRWKSYDGTQIEGWLMFPYGYEARKGPYPLIVMSHGGPHSATGYSFDFKKQFFAANGYFVFDTNFRSSTGYGDAFKWATWGAWGKKDGEDVMSGIDMVLQRYPIDPKRVGHTGHSYGGFMTNWLITQYPDRFAAAITGAGISNWISDYGTADIYRTKETEFFGTPWDQEARDRMIRQSPLSFAGNVKTPTLFIHGEVDQRVPYEEGEQMYFALKRRGVPARMIQYAGQPHGISGHWNNVHRMLNELWWWNRYLKDTRAVDQAF